MLWNADVKYEVQPYKLESEVEKAIQVVKGTLFGPNRIYLDVKKKIGGKKKNIPDGYLLDLSSSKTPRLYVVEVELAAHEPIRHVAVQLLEFSLAFEQSEKNVKEIVRKALDAEPAQKQKCERYAKANGFENIDRLLERMIYDAEFGALVIIDELVDDLETLLVRKFKFGVEVIQLRRYRGTNKTQLYEFEPFLADLTPADVAGRTTLDPSDVDTIVVPARRGEDGFDQTFLDQNRWYSIRIHGSMIPRIKYIAAYVTAPTSAITHWAPVKSIEQWKDTAKYVVNFSEPAKPIGPLKLVRKSKVRALQNARYTSRERLLAAKTLDEVF